MSTLAIDYGIKRIGLALSPKGVAMVVPYGLIDNTEDANVFTQISKKIKEGGVSKIILGVPIDMEGQETAMTERIRKFGASLEQATGMTVIFVDERFTTAQGKRMSGGVSDDEKAAMVLLETYLE